VTRAGNILFGFGDLRGVNDTAEISFDLVMVIYAGPGSLTPWR
jgi:hypothetical protein